MDPSRSHRPIHVINNYEGSRTYIYIGFIKINRRLYLKINTFIFICINLIQSQRNWAPRTWSNFKKSDQELRKLNLQQKSRYLAVSSYLYLLPIIICSLSIG